MFRPGAGNCSHSDTEVSNNLRRGTMRVAQMHQLYVRELRDLYSAQSQLLIALPKMARAAQSVELSREFEDHLWETEHHVERLVRIFDDLGLSPEGKKCQAMEGLLAAVQEQLNEVTDP